MNGPFPGSMDICQIKMCKVACDIKVCYSKVCLKIAFRQMSGMNFQTRSGTIAEEMQ